MTLANFLTGIADKLRLYLGGDKIPAQSFADKIDDVYGAGQSSMVDESKIVENTASGNPVTVDDVSEIPHEVTARLSSKNVFPGFEDYDSETKVGVTLTVDEDGTIHLNGTATANGVFGTRFYNVLKKQGRYYLCDFATGEFPASNIYRTQVYDDTTNTILMIRSDADSDAVETAELSFPSPYFRIQVVKGHTYNDCTLRPTLFYREKPTEYVPYRASLSGVSVTKYGENQTGNPETYTANEKGVIEGIKSLSPYMRFVSDADVNIDVDYHKSWGMQTEYDRFWDVYQLKGYRTNYSYAFAGQGWQYNNFYPKYDMKPTSAQQMFYSDNTVQTSQIDLVERLEKCGVTLDFSNCTTLNNIFNSNSIITRVGVIDIRKSTNNNSLFSYAVMETVDKMIVDENTVFTTLFNYANNLKNIVIEGVIASKDVNLQWSKNLSHDSIESVINALSGTTSGLTITLSLDAVNKAFETEEGLADGSLSSEWTKLVASKSNWTISLI